MRAFVVDGEAAVARLDGEERDVVATLIADVAVLLGAEHFSETNDGDASAPGSGPPSDEDMIRESLAGIADSVETPHDPAVLALLPHASKDDDALAQEFRRLTEHDMRNLKVARLKRMWEALSTEESEWRVSLDEALPTAAALTDVRLVLASRLGVSTEDDAELLRMSIATAIDSEEAPTDEGAAQRLWWGMVYESLGWLQESLLDALSFPGQEPDSHHDGDDTKGGDDV